jgi:hypothetical protein
MDQELLQYNRIVEDALRSVVRTSLEQVATYGLPGEHSLYVTFDTGFPEVDIPERIRAQYPEEMTVVLEHQFWDLNVADDFFEVTLSFNRRRERLFVPWEAVTSFADPSVPFGLKFQIGDEEDAHPAAPPPIAADQNAGPLDEDGLEREVELADTSGDEMDDAQRGEVVNLDQFRKNR